MSNVWKIMKFNIQKDKFQQTKQYAGWMGFILQMSSSNHKKVGFSFLFKMATSPARV